MQCRFDLADVRTVVEVDQPAHCTFGEAKPSGQCGVADTLGAHRAVEGDFRGRKCGQGDSDAPTRWRRPRDGTPITDVATERGDQAILRLCPRFCQASRGAK